MDKVSIIIPARGEKEENLLRTVKSIYENATGDYEVIVGFNGEPYVDFVTKIEPRSGWIPPKVIKFPENIGIKGNINTLALLATGKYLFKLDAHCAVGKGFDEILQADMQDDWIVTPRFYVLDGKTWEWQDGEFYDYFYLSCPFTDKRGLRFKAGGHWPERTMERNPELMVYEEKKEGVVSDTPLWIDKTPQMHGSGWFMTKDRFFELGGFPLQDPYGHGQEPIWLGLKNWLTGGKLMVNKKTWYAHLHQDSKDRGYPEDKKHTEQTYNHVARWWLLNKEPNLIHNFEWFVDKFYPMPTWPENWKKLYFEWGQGEVYL